MIPRSVSIVIGVPIVLAATYFGGTGFYLLIMALALVCLNEFYAMMAKKGFQPSYLLGNLLTIFFISFAQYTLKHPVWEPVQAVILTLGIILTFSGSLFLQKTTNAVVNIAITILGMVYIGWLFSYFILIRALAPHGIFMFFLLATVWTNDTAAYLVGKAIGRWKLAPFVSPKKTIEGATAGFVAGTVVAAIFGQTVGYLGFAGFHATLLGAMVCIVAQVGDLVESLIKRDADAKDSGSILPGHGGALDRMDSFILTAPFVYYYLMWILFR